MITADTKVVTITKVIIIVETRTGHEDRSVELDKIKSIRIRRIETIGTIMVVGDGNTIISLIKIQTDSNNSRLETRMDSATVITVNIDNGRNNKSITTNKSKQKNRKEQSRPPKQKKTATTET